jgi:hypothetical protein
MLMNKICSAGRCIIYTHTLGSSGILKQKHRILTCEPSGIILKLKVSGWSGTQFRVEKMVENHDMRLFSL